MAEIQGAGRPARHVLASTLRYKVDGITVVKGATRAVAGENTLTRTGEMSAVTEFLYPAPARRTVGSILGWWEKRRLGYNMAVGSAGVLSLGLSYLFAMLPPGGQSMPLPVPWIPIAIFGVMANVCYMFGPTSEILIDKLWGRSVLPTGPALFRMGLTFSVGLALFPALLMMFVWVARIVFTVL